MLYMNLFLPGYVNTAKLLHTSTNVATHPLCITPSLKSKCEPSYSLSNNSLLYTYCNVSALPGTPIRLGWVQHTPSLTFLSPFAPILVSSSFVPSGGQQRIGCVGTFLLYRDITSLLGYVYDVSLG